MRIEIVKDGRRGMVEYDEAASRVTVTFDGPAGAAVAHLTEPREFQVPESQRIDDYRVETARPTDSRMHMELALCELYAETGFWVDWETLEG
jgi:hypothetical protein